MMVTVSRRYYMKRLGVFFQNDAGKVPAKVPECIVPSSIVVN